jgi:polysaccharide biosynthesis transport protein
MVDPPEDLRVRDLLGDGPFANPGPPPAPASPPPAAPVTVPQVVVETGGEKEPAGQALPFDPLLLLVGLRRRKLQILLVAAAVFLLSLPLALMMRTKKWEVWVTILRKKEQSEFVVTSNTPIVRLQVYSMQTVLRLVKVHENLKSVIDQLKLKIGPDDLSKQVTVTNPKDTDLVEILVAWKDPKEAAEIANRLARAFLVTIERLKKLEATQTYDYLEGQLREAGERLAAADEEMVTFKSENGVIKLSDQAGKLIEELSSYSTLAERERLDAEMAATAERATREQLRKQESTVVASIFVKKPLHARLVELQTQLAGALSVYTEESAKVKELRDEIAGTESLVRQGLEEQLQEQTVSRNPVLTTLEQALVERAVEAVSKDARAKGYEAARDRHQQRLKELPELESRLAEMQQRLDTLRQVNATLASRIEEVRIIRDSTAASFSIMQEARIPEHPLPSKAKLVLVAGLFLGGMLGVGVALAKEIGDTTLKALGELEGALGLKPLAEIPVLPPERTLLLSLAGPPDVSSEVFREMAAAVLQQRSGPGWTLLVTGGTRFEGRTTVALNLAQVAAARGLSVLFVDADVRKPNLPLLGPLLGLPHDARGLSALLRGELPPPGPVFRPDGAGPSYVPFGDPAGLLPESLGSEAMRAFLAAVRPAYDLVLLDGPPVLGASDALLLAPLVDAALYVAEAHGLPRAAHKEAVAKLTGTGLTVAGAVLNKVQAAYAQEWAAHSVRAKERPA